MARPRKNESNVLQEPGELIYQIFDTQTQKYVMKNTYSHYGFPPGNKFVWKAPGHAKNACMILINFLSREEYLKNNGHDDGYYSSPYNIKHFKDQTRFQIHEMKLSFNRICP